MSHVVARWPDGARIIRRIRRISEGVSLGYLPAGRTDADPSTASLYFSSDGSGRDVDLAEGGAVTVQKDSWPARMRLLWLLTSTRPIPVAREVGTEAAALGVPFLLEEILANKIGLGAPIEEVAASSGGRWDRHGAFRWSIPCGHYTISVQKTAGTSLDATPEARAAIRAWRDRRPERSVLETPEYPEWCVVGPSSDGKLLSMGDTPWEALRACRLVMWPREEETWARTWTDPGELVLPDPEEVQMFRMLGEGFPLWWRNNLWEEWIRSRE